MTADLLADAAWEVCATAPGLITDPSGLTDPALRWAPATVPGTGAGALRAAGRGTDPAAADPDAFDWWFRTRIADGAPGAWWLELDGVATISEVWVDGQPILQSQNMFRRQRARLPAVSAGTEIVVRCAALAPVLAQRRPRPRWRSTLVDQQGLRWFRTSLIGRMPSWSTGRAAVGLWRPARLVPADTRRAYLLNLETSVDGTAGVVRIELDVESLVTDEPARLSADGRTASVDLRYPTVTVRVGVQSTSLTTDDGTARGELRIPDVQRWWPHTHGPQPLYDLSVTVDGVENVTRRIGFRTVTADTSDDGFTVHVNDVPVFLRGACWVPLDTHTLASSATDVHAAVAQARAGGMNVLRVTATNVYEDSAFWDACDELGLLVWQDLMVANIDLPEDEAFVADLTDEVTDVLGDLQGRPALAVVSGGNEVEQQAAMMGLPAESRVFPVLDGPVHDAVAAAAPGVPWVRSSPTGGALPIDVGSGVAHWFGVGAYLRPLSDVRTAHVRFAAECLAFSNPPERSVVEELPGGAARAAHHPASKAAVPRDAFASWDFEDVRDHYVAELFGVDVRALRYSDAERYLDLGRAAVAELVRHVFTDWRRPASTCTGGIVLSLRDFGPGAGWGLISSDGTPKAPFHAMRRATAPLAVLVTDEGLDGLHLHVVNDTAADISGALTLTGYAHGELRVVDGSIDVEVPARGGATVAASAVLGAFRDLNHAFAFGPADVDCVHVALTDVNGATLAETVHLTLGQRRPREPDLGLTARAQRDGDSWLLEVGTARLAQWVSVEISGFSPDDSWFHVPPGRTVRTRLTAHTPGARPSGVVRALNALRPASVVIEG